MAIRVRVDPDSCQSSGRCIASAPEAFSFDADRLARARAAAGELGLERAREIARGCPALAIEVYDEEGELVEL
jgi:ferredoxin